MDLTKRYITKIGREAQRYAKLRLQGTNIGTSEYECLDYIRKHSGISQETLRSFLNVDKAAVARMIANLERKGYVYRLQDENDKRAKKLFVTDKTVDIKNMTSSIEASFYEWLLEDVAEDEKEIFLKVLGEIYIKSKMERRVGFKNIKKRDVVNYGEIED